MIHTEWVWILSLQALLLRGAYAVTSQLFLDPRGVGMAFQVFFDPHGVGMYFMLSVVFAARRLRENFSSVFGSTRVGYSFLGVF